MNSLNGNITKDGFGASQDIEGHLQYAQEMRSSIQENTNVRSFAIIPDIIAIDIYSKHKIDVHSDEFLSSPEQLKRIRHIIKSEYPKLLTGGVSNRYSLGAL
jgi:hypothetical protein